MKGNSLYRTGERMTPGGETVNKTKAGNALGSRTSGFGGWERV